MKILTKKDIFLFQKNLQFYMQDGKQIAGRIFREIAIMPHNEIFNSNVQKLSRYGTIFSTHKGELR